MATTAKKPAAAGKATKSTAKPAAKATATKAPAKPRAKKADAVPPPPVVYVSAYTVGNKVTHPTFGDGKVISIDRDQLTIKFASAEKVILDGFVKAGPKG